MVSVRERRREKKNERDRKISRKPEMVFKEIGNVE